MVSCFTSPGNATVQSKLHAQAGVHELSLGKVTVTIFKTGGKTAYGSHTWNGKREAGAGSKELLNHATGDVILDLLLPVDTYSYTNR